MSRRLGRHLEVDVLVGIEEPDPAQVPRVTAQDDRVRGGRGGRPTA